MQIIFWISLISLFHVYIGYLIICIIAAKLFKQPIDKQEIFPTVTLLIPAYNEQPVIKAKIENSLALEYPKDKLKIVIASESTDNTNQLVSEYLDQGIVLHAFAQRRGKSRMLYDVVGKTTGEIIVFSDANAMYKPDVISKLVRNFNDRKIGGVLGSLIITNPDDSSISEGESVFKKYESILRKANTAVHSIIGADGTMLAIRRDLYKPISPERGDDFEIALRIRVQGYGMVFEPEAISYEKASVDFQAEIKRKRRIVSWFWKSALILLSEMVNPWQGFLIFQVISNKIMRWLSPVFLIALFVSSLSLAPGSIFYGLFFQLQVFFYCVAMLGGIFSKKTENKLEKILRMPFFFIVFNYAFLIGTIEGLFLKQKPFWQKVR
ncbi:MAG: glycosyltransferase family 2 protein [Candidatus Omnitrophica bacterium]|nr:glycosyltransferase family 2 protein [Candidatus Omnitrophota bacterium]